MTPSASSPASAVPALREAGQAQRRSGAGTLSAARVLLIATLLAAPLPVGSVGTWAWASLTVLILLALLLWGIGSVQQGSLRILWSPLYWPAALFLLLGIVQFVCHLTVDSLATREFLLKLFTNLVIFFLAGQLLVTSPPSLTNKLGNTFTVYLFSLSLLAILQYFTGTGLIYWTVRTETGSSFGPYVNHNHYAGLMEMLIPLAGTYMISRPKSDRLWPLLGFAVLIAIAALMLSGSRGGLVSFIAETIILSVVLLWRRPKSEGHRLATAGTLVILAAVLFFFWIDPGQVSKHLATVVNPRGEPSFSSRLTTARDSLRIFRDHPWMGTGLGSFETAFPAYQESPTDLTWDHAHNDYAEMLAESGLVGGLLVLWALLLFFRLTLKNLDKRILEHSGWMQLGATLAVCGLLVHSFIDFNLHIPANAAWFSACVGMAQRNLVSSRREGKVDARWVN